MKRCSDCGETHYGDTECPYTKLEPCSICEELTLYACSDCRIDTQKTIPVCVQSACRDKHEQLVHPKKSTLGLAVAKARGDIQSAEDLHASINFLNTVTASLCGTKKQGEPTPPPTEQPKGEK
jgi:hypothetical protein